MRPEKDKMSEHIVSILSETIRGYISFISDSYKIRDGYESTKGTKHYGFIPSRTMSILEALYVLYIHMDGGYRHYNNRYSFLDIGCGIGNVVLLAEKVGFDAYGLEYNNKIYNVAKKFIDKYHIFKGDMTNFRNYDKYDVLYCYSPINDGKVMTKFTAKLAKAVKPGAYVILNGYSYIFGSSKEFELVKLKSNSYYPIYRKKETQ